MADDTWTAPAEPTGWSAPDPDPSATPPPPPPPPPPTPAATSYPASPPSASPPPEPPPAWRPPAGSGDQPDWLRGAPTPGRTVTPTATPPVATSPGPPSTAPWFPTRPAGEPAGPGGPGGGTPGGGLPGGLVPPVPPDARRGESSGGRRGPGVGFLVAAVVLAALVGSLSTIGVMSLVSGDRVVERVVQAPLQLAGEELDIGGLLAKAQPSVVLIRTGGASTGGVYGGAGSGVIISEDGLVLTNAHVMGNNASAEVTLFDGETRQAILVGSSREDDIALISLVDPPALTPAELGNSADVRVGDSVVAIGNALNLGGTPSVTLGIVSAKDREIQAPGNIVLRNLIQTDAAINPGNSGGPLLNALGQVVGINTAIISDAQSIGFAIAIDAVKPLIDEIQAEGDIAPDDAFLGVSMVAVADLLEATRQEYGVTVDQGVFVTEVVPGSAASAAGFQPGDVIVDVDGEPVRSSSDVSNIIRSLAPGDSLTMRVIRDGEEIEVTAVLGTRGG